LIILNLYKGIDLKYGIFATALLWPARDANVEEEQHEALQTVFGEETRRLLLGAIGKWDADQLAGERIMAKQAADNPYQPHLTRVLDRIKQYKGE